MIKTRNRSLLTMLSDTERGYVRDSSMAAMADSVRDVIGRALRHMEKVGAIKIEGQRILLVMPEKLREML